MRPEGPVEARELDADGARADDEKRLRKALRNHRLLVGPNQPAVGLEPGKRLRPRAGGDDDVLGGDRRQRLALFTGQRDAPLPFEPRRAIDHGDAVFLHEKRDAVRQALCHFAAARDHFREIETDIVGAQAELARVLHQVVDLGGAEQRLGGNAAPVEADAAETVTLDDRGLHTELGRANGGHIAAGSAADDDEIEFRIAHVREANPSLTSTA